MATTAETAVPQTFRRLVIVEPARFSWHTLSHGITELARYGDLLRTLTPHRVRVRYKQSALGFAWALLQPLAMTVIFVGVFSVLGGVPTDGAPYPLFAFTDLLVWSFFSTAVATATNGLVGHATKVCFPREILPLSYVIAAGFDFLVASLVLGLLLAYYGVDLSLAALSAIPVFLLLIGLATAISLILSAVQVSFRDIGIAMPLMLQLWFFGRRILSSGGALASASSSSVTWGSLRKT